MLASKIDRPYEKHDCTRICQGDISRDYSLVFVSPKEGKVEELSFPYLVVLTQDCDLEQFYSNLKNQKENNAKLNQFLPNILVIPAFPSEQAREGNHLKELFDVAQDRLASDIWKRVKQNKDERYHLLPPYQDFQVPELLLDFKTYMTVSYEDFSTSLSKNYLVTINELFRDDLSHRFCSYLSRIGLPDISVPPPAC